MWTPVCSDDTTGVNMSTSDAGTGMVGVKRAIRSLTVTHAWLAYAIAWGVSMVIHPTSVKALAMVIALGIASVHKHLDQIEERRNE